MGASQELQSGYITDSECLTRKLTNEEQGRSTTMAPPGMPKVVNASAIEQLDLLSRRSEWYAQMYVASFIRKHPAFPTVELIARLQTDPNQLVQSIIAEIFKADVEMK